MEDFGIFAVLLCWKLSGAWGKGIVVLNALQSNSFTYKDTHEIEGKHKLLQYHWWRCIWNSTNIYYKNAPNLVMCGYYLVYLCVITY